MGITVTALAVTPVKGMRLRAVDAVELSELGARGNRAFYVIDEKRRLMNGKGTGSLQAVVPDYDADTGELTFTFPSGELVGGRVQYGEEIQTKFFGSIYFAKELVGPVGGRAVGVPRTSSARGGAGARGGPRARWGRVTDVARVAAPARRGRRVRADRRAALSHAHRGRRRRPPRGG